jgi:hypothetical protein
VLTVLNLSGSLIGEPPAQTLNMYAAKRPRHHAASLACFPLGDCHVAALGNTANQLTKILDGPHLNKSTNPPGNQGVDVVCRALRTNAFLRDLDLSRVPVDDKAANAVAQVGGGCEQTELDCRDRFGIL